MSDEEVQRAIRTIVRSNQQFPALMGLIDSLRSNELEECQSKIEALLTVRTCYVTTEISSTDFKNTWTCRWETKIDMFKNLEDFVYQFPVLFADELTTDKERWIKTSVFPDNVRYIAYFNSEFADLNREVTGTTLLESNNEYYLQIHLKRRINEKRDGIIPFPPRAFGELEH